MEYQSTRTAPSALDGDVLIAGHFADEELPRELRALDESLGGRIQRAKERGRVKGELYELSVFDAAPALPVETVLLVGLGKRKEADRLTYLRAATAAGARVAGLKASRVVALMSGKRFLGMDLGERAALLAQGMVTGPYNPGLYKKRDEAAAFGVSSLTFAPVETADRRAVLKGAQEGEIIGEAVNTCRDWVNEPPNVLTPAQLADRVRQAAEEAGVECEVLEKKQIASLNMNLFLSVGQGSAQPPRLVTLRYRGSASAPALGLVGKGITFDTGGISIKPSASMEEMKSDMAGAASVAAAVLAAARLRLPVNVTAMLPLTENMPSGTATRPGDIVRGRNGKTVEINNTDAEGRLILADTLSYLTEQGVDRVLDVATLTGGMVVALGFAATGYMSNDEAFARDIEKAAARAGERIWRLPLFPEYLDLMKSTFADLKNAGGRYASPVSAAAFLREFVNETPWAHLDIAGPSFVETGNAYRPAGATGEPVRTLIEIIRNTHKVRK